MGRTKSYDEMTKEEIIKKEKSKFSAICKNIEPGQKKALEALVGEAAFMGASLFELRKAIDKKGYTEKYQNGANQKGVKKCSEVEIYNVMIKNYTAVIKQIMEIAEKNGKKVENGKENDDDFFAFLKMRP